MLKLRPHVVVDLAPNLGYSLQVARGLGRFRSKIPEWVFLRCGTEFLGDLDDIHLLGAIGHYHSREHFDALEASTVPYHVTISSRSMNNSSAKVIPDNVAVGRMAAEYLLKKGHKRFAVARLNFSFASDREAGFRSVLHDAGIDAIFSLNPWNPSFVPKHLPMAVFAGTDTHAQTIINNFMSRGYKVPEDIAVLGVDDDELVALYAPIPISSVRLPLEKIGFNACESLETMVEQGKQDFGTITFPPVEVVERRSTGVFALNDPRVRRARAYIEDHFKSISDVNEIAQQAKVSRRTLERIFFKFIGMTPAEYLMRRRTEHAEQLLRETDYTVEHIAELSGFDERRRLYRSFSRLGRPAPSLVRKGSGR